MAKGNQVEVSFYASLRQAVGQKSVNFDFPSTVTVRELIAEIIQKYPQLERGLSGDMDEHVNILVNGRDVRYLDGNFDNLLEDGDQVSIFPALAGG
jgi:molybdopterin synthase sulfur carrier subunit